MTDEQVLDTVIRLRNNISASFIYHRLTDKGERSRAAVARRDGVHRGEDDPEIKTTTNLTGSSVAMYEPSREAFISALDDAEKVIVHLRQGVET
jgi:hypothetical protein